MTTIAYREGQLAADTQLTNGGLVEGFRRKIGRRGRVLFAAAGLSSLCLNFEAWVRSGCDGAPPSMGGREGPNAVGLIFTDDGRCVKFCPDEGALSFTAPFYAYGSGGVVALGALEHGASAEEAVASAMRWDTCTGGEITVLRHDP